jgi:simple sugar transport system substrate-binding protein
MALTALAATVLIGCGEKPASAAHSHAMTANPVGPLKVAFVYVGPIGDAGWTRGHDDGRKAVEAEYGDRVETAYVESVPESAADAERVIRQLASDGNRLIFGTTFGYMEAMLKVAKDFPDVKFEHVTGFKTAKNLAQYDVRTYEGAYLAGIAAGKLTKTDKLGVVASLPIPEVVRNIDAFTLGARESNPNVTTRVVWTNQWFDPGKEREAATSLIGQDVDVMMQNTDSASVVQTAQQNGIYAFGWDSDMTGYGREAHAAASIIDWGHYYTQRVGQVLDGTWKTGSVWLGLKDKAIDLKAFNSAVPDDIKALVEARKKTIIDGSAPIWKGPVLDNNGEEMIARGTVADDAFLHGIKFYVDGVQGRVPG